MRPTDDEIQQAAYDRWERRGWRHGGDRDDWLAAETDLTFLANYRTIASFTLEGPETRVLGDGKARRCRFCERTAGPGGFGDPRPVIPGRVALLTGEVCDDCQADWREALQEGFREFWARLRREADAPPAGGGPFTIAAFKAMAAAALASMPAPELRYFVDALEWVTNPDQDSDDQLLDRAECRVYRAPFLGVPPRVSLARRVDDEFPAPYLFFFIEGDGLMVQVPLPMCLRDQDLDGLAVVRPERRPIAGHGPGFREARGVLLPLSVSPRRTGRARRLPAVAS